MALFTVNLILYIFNEDCRQPVATRGFLFTVVRVTIIFLTFCFQGRTLFSLLMSSLFDELYLNV